MKNGIEIHFAFAESIAILKMAMKEVVSEIHSLKISEEANNSGELLEKLLKRNKPPHISLISINDWDNLFKTLQDVEFMKLNWPTMDILIYTVPLHEYFIHQLIRLGVNGILDKRDDHVEDILEAMGNIRVSGFHYGSLARQQEFEAVRQKKIDVSPLTEREIRLIRDRSEGKTYRETAIALNEKYSTVYWDCKKLRSKLNIKESFGLTIFGVKAGLEIDIFKGLLSTLKKNS